MKKRVQATKKQVEYHKKTSKIASKHDQHGVTGMTQPHMPVVATDNGILHAFGSLETAKRPSTKDIPKTTTGLAYPLVCRSRPWNTLYSDIQHAFRLQSNPESSTVQSTYGNK